jgi:outer membrane protein OmpA-like peptidoglycan-associated protein
LKYLPTGRRPPHPGNKVPRRPARRSRSRILTKDLRDLPGTVFDVTYTPETVRIDESSWRASLASVSSDGNVLVFDQPDAKVSSLREGSTMFLENLAVRQDVESLSQFSAEDSSTLTFTYSGSGFHRRKNEVIVDQAFHTNPFTFCRSEIPASGVYVGRMYDQHPSVFVAGNYHQISTHAFEQLKEAGSAQIVIHTHAVMRNKRLTFEGDEAVTLRRTDHGDAKYHVIVNDQPTDLPVITADGKSNTGSATLHFAAVDDPAFPMVVAWEWSGQSDSSKIVKITYPVQNKIEKELKDQGRAEIYGIYFDFDSDQIRSESEPVLAEIADILKKQPEWKLNVEGHTDNVGGDKHNLDLSERRAASVIHALVARYLIAAERLSPTGYGAARPKASNDTVVARSVRAVAAGEWRGPGKPPPLRD